MCFHPTFLLGIMGKILNCRQGIGAVGIVILVYLFQKIFNFKWEFLAVIGLLIISVSYIFDFSFIEVCIVPETRTFV